MTNIEKTPETIYLKDYQVPHFLISQVHLFFDLHDDKTTVTATLHCQRNSQSPDQSAPLVLDGEELALERVALDGVVLDASQYAVDESSLRIADVPSEFTLETVVEIHPENNTRLSGLYVSSDNFCTQCESQGFRRITYYLDRPDVLAKFSVAIVAGKKYPYLLSNGNLIEEKTLEDGRHWVLWQDPFPKPAYLFALVAGDFDLLHEQFTTCSGKTVDCYLYLEKGYKEQGDHALQSLLRSMRWDEEVYGREYDLDSYMIVAVSDFNFGAMENKSLNIFNTKYVLADAATATDQDYVDIEDVIGHEYFHNWSGNRVTLRDWFQITLKEGFTVFRDQSFSADMTSHVAKRIQEVNVMRTVQFAEAAGPMAHPIQPQQYIEISNFYTVTVYNKGAEVIRMMHTLLGADTFRKATDDYFARFDGQAATTEDFVACMERASGKDLTQFRRWYVQAGTPRVQVTGQFDEAAKQYHLTVKQSIPETAAETATEPMHFPMSVALLDSDGNDIEGTAKVLEVTEAEQTFQFSDITAEPTPSLFRHFSAPVQCDFPYQLEKLALLACHDADLFNRWDACQRLATLTLLDLVEQHHTGQTLEVNAACLRVFGHHLSQPMDDQRVQSLLLSLPNEMYLNQQLPKADVDAVHTARRHLLRQIASNFHNECLALYQQLQSRAAYEYSPAEMGRRALRNTLLLYLSFADEDYFSLAVEQFNQADNMTDSMAALATLNHHESEEREQVFQAFYQRWQNEPLVMDKWLQLQAGAGLPKTLDRVKALTSDPVFQWKNPNKVRALVGVFSSNLACFHAKDGSGYEFLVDCVLKVDPINGQVAARLLPQLIRWRAYDDERAQLMKAQLQRISEEKNISKDVYEMVHKAL